MAEYLYESARVRALENRLPTREQLEALILASDWSVLLARLKEIGISVVLNERGELLREETLVGMLHAAQVELADVMVHDGAVRLWLYPYDCNNVKAAIKGFFRGVDPRRMTFDFGTVSVERLINMVQSGDFEGLPANMQRAATEAMQAYAKAQNPQTIDLLLDAACFADMLAAATQSGDAFALSMVQTKIDLTNLLTAVRLLRMGRDGEAMIGFFNEAMLEGGTLTRETLNEWIMGGEDYLWSRLYHTPLGWLSEQLAGRGKTLTAVERFADNCWMQQLKPVKFSAYGRAVLIAYWLATEYAVKNLRIILAGHAAGLSAETIRERVRDGYV